MRAPVLLVPLAFVVVSDRPAGAEDPVTVTVGIHRQYPGDRCTSGYLSVEGEIIVYALERPWIDNLKNVSSIPEGTYEAHLRYDKKDHWRIELKGVPGRDGIQIHVGNQPEESKGCVLVGEKLGDDLCSLEGSRKAYKKLKKAFHGSEREAAYDPRKIVVKINGPTK